MRFTLVVLGMLFSALTFAADAKDVKVFFDKNKVGSSADYGVFKRKQDYIITVHGFDDDLEVCLEIVAMLNKEQPDTYSCKPLNH